MSKARSLKNKDAPSPFRSYVHTTFNPPSRLPSHPLYSLSPRGLNNTRLFIIPVTGLQLRRSQFISRMHFALDSDACILQLYLDNAYSIMQRNALLATALPVLTDHQAQRTLALRTNLGRLSATPSQVLTNHEARCS